jgi:hypothetical protein
MPQIKMTRLDSDPSELIKPYHFNREIALYGPTGAPAQLVGPMVAKLVPPYAGHFFEGKWDTDFLCGNCGHLLAKSLLPDQLQEVILKCPACQLYNR